MTGVVLPPNGKRSNNKPGTEQQDVRGQLFQKYSLDQNDLDFEISHFAIPGHVVRLAFMPFFQSKVELYHLNTDAQFSRLPNLDYQCSKWVYKD